MEPVVKIRKLESSKMYTATSILILLFPLVRSVSFSNSHTQAPLLDPTSEATYARVIFSNGEEQFFRNWECPDGVWGEDMHLNSQVKCVCVKGAYAIGTTLCDDEFKILTGDDHCFEVGGQTIRKIIPLTGKSGFAGRANTVFRKDGPYFARLTSSTPTTSVGEVQHYVFRMNDPSDFSVYAKLGNGKASRLKCFEGQSVADDPVFNPVMQIAKLPNCSNEFRGPKPWCKESDYSDDYQWTLSIGQSWAQKGGETSRGAKYPGSCLGAAAVPGKKPGATGGTAGRKKRSTSTKLPPKKGGPGVPGAPSETVEDSPKCDKFPDASIEPEEHDTSVDHFYQVEVLDPSQQFQSTSSLQKLVNEQNKRIGHQIRRYYMDGIQGVIDAPRFVNFTEFKYVQLSKEILSAVCPKEAIQGPILEFLIRAFRLLYIDSSKNYPYPIKPNEHEDKRIIEALTLCKDSAAPIYFIRNESCPGLGVFGTNQSDIIRLYNVNLTLPGQVSFNSSSMDMAIELVWKLTLLSHYYCSNQFNWSFDHSLMFIKMEAMMKNPVMQFRWYYPGQFNRMAQFFLMSYDLQKFTTAVDRCVVTAFAGSNYTEWMTRPAEMGGWMGKSKKLPHNFGSVVNSALGNSNVAPKPKPGRKRRFYIQDDMWDKKAYCMHTTDAPYSEVRTGTFLSCRKKPIWFDNTD